MRIRRPVLLLLSLLLSACGSAPTVDYTLTPAPAARPVAAVPLMPPIEVGEVSIPGVIDRDAVVVAAPGGQLDVSGTAIWGGPLQQMIRSTLSTNLASRLPSGSVLSPGDPAPPGGLRILLLNVLRFWGDTGGHVTLAADWVLTRNGKALSDPHHEVITVAAGSGKVSTIVPAMSRALGMLADRIAAALG